MKYLTIFIIIIISSCTSPDFNQIRNNLSHDFSLMSLNIHYYEPTRDKTDWDNRKYAVTSAIKDINPDIIIFQEMETFERGGENRKNLQLEWVLQTSNGYQPGAFGDSEIFPITQPILYKEDYFTLLKQGYFFFSDTPDQIYATPWDGRWSAYTTWVLLHDKKSEKDFYIFNTHLDAFSLENRTKGSELIRDRILSRERPELPIILGGDFNVLKNSKLLNTIKEAGIQLVPLKGSSFHFRMGLNLYPSIDHILYSPEVELASGAIIQKKWDTQWPSDHHPVYASFRWK
jgi:endonuclease/exonuclease/phosphatase family metal-dependent hydrolase